MINLYRNMANLRCRGQGLVETLIVILFVSISAVTLLSLGHYLSYSTNITQQQMDANLLAIKKIETLRDFQVLNTQAGYTSYQEIAGSSESATVGNTTYTLIWTVTSNTNPTYKIINLTVSWTDRNGVSRSIQLITEVAGIDPGSSGSFM
jgi:Tfp pilus assembly protein PilE